MYIIAMCVYICTIALYMYIFLNGSPYCKFLPFHKGKQKEHLHIRTTLFSLSLKQYKLLIKTSLLSYTQKEPPCNRAAVSHL